MSYFNQGNCQLHPKSSKNSRFQFIEEEDLSLAVGKVRRQRAKKRDETVWTNYCASQIEKLFLPDPKENCTSDKTELDINITNFEEDHFTKSNSDDEASKFKTDEENKDPKHFSQIRTDEEFATNMSEYLMRANKKKALGYSNITLVSSHRAETSGDGNVDPTEKLKAIRLKLKQVLELIGSNLNTFRVPDDSVEVAQIQKKATEFCARFSRNHLYQVGRHLNEITKTLNYCLPYNQWKQNAAQSKSVITLHQLVFQAYLMFQRHMRIVWGFGGTQEKLHTLLQLTLEINRVCVSHQDPTDASYAELENICQKLIESLNEIPDDNNSTHSVSIVEYQVLSPAVAPRKVKSADSRIYYGGYNEQNIKLSSQNPVRKRIESTMSGDRYSMYRTKPLSKMINQNKHWNPGPHKSKSTTRIQTNQNKGWLKTDHIFTPNKPLTYRKFGRNVCTDQYNSANTNTPKQTNSAQHSKRQKYKPHNDMEIKITTKPNSVCDQDNDNATDRICFSKNLDFKTIHEPAATATCSHFDDKDLVNVLIPLLSKHFQKIHPDKAPGERRRDVRPEKALGVGRPHPKPFSSKDVITSGNVQLHIISHDESPPPSTSKSPTENIATDENLRTTTKSAELPGKAGPKVLLEKNKRIVSKTSQIPTRTRNEEVLKAKLPTKSEIPKGLENAILKYRMDYIKHIAKSPMYARSSVKKPWEVVSRISEELIEDALNQVTEELEMEALLKQMIDVELLDLPKQQTK